MNPVNGRVFFAAAGGSRAAARQAAGAGAAASAEPLRFVMVTDTHVVPWDEARNAVLRRIFLSIAKRSPVAVINCGDVTEYGTQAEFDAYLSAIPADMRSYAVPGNHEVRWDPRGKALFVENFKDRRFSFSAGGIRFLGLDPTQVLMEPGVFTTEHFEWLRPLPSCFSCISRQGRGGTTSTTRTNFTSCSPNTMCVGFLPGIFTPSRCGNSTG